MKVVAYLRVSTDRQAAEGLGLDVQEQAIRAWAKAGKHRIVAVLTDAGVSGGNDLDGRPALADALELLRAKEAAAVVVYRLDRLARDLVLQEQLLAEIRRMGADLFSTFASEGDYLADDPADPSRKLIRQVLGAVAEYEKAMTVLRLKSGRRRKAEKGGFAFGSPAYGLKSVDGTLTPVESEQAAITRAKELRAAGASLRAIAETLTAEGHQPKRGTVWHPPTVARVLERAGA